MAEARPELIFVAGPQTGQRAVVMSDHVVVGRQGTCGIHLEESFASREQFRLVASPQGWILENLSPKGTRVNGKRFKKASQQVLLATGDVLGAGEETRMLFVSPGDDADAALAAYREAHGPLPKARPAQAAAAPPPAPPAAPSAAPPPAPAPPRPGPPPPPPPSGGLGPVEPVEVVEAPAGPSSSDARVRKYLIYGGIYLGAMAIVFGCLALFCNRQEHGPIGPEGAPANWYDNIPEAIEARIERPFNDSAAEEHLEQARAFSRRTYQLTDLQQCVMHFKLHLAYGNLSDLASPADAELYRIQRAKLIDSLQKLYFNAWTYEQGGKWAESEQLWEEMQRVLGHGDEWNTDEYQSLVRNVFDHAAFVRKEMALK